MGKTSHLQAFLGLPNRSALAFWLAVAAIYLPVAVYFQFAFLSNPLTEPHLRQSQTGLTTYYFARHEIPFLDYRSPLGGTLWNEVHELPLYQWLCARLMNFGLSQEVASRGLSLVFFLAGLALLICILRRLLDRQTVAWAALLYVVSPFNILFSRAALIDYPCLFFVYLSFWCLLRSLDPVERRFKLWMVAALVSGSLAAAIKVTLWVFPAIATGIYVLWLFWKRPEQRERLAWLGGQLVVQGAVALGWTSYANNIQRLAGNYGRDFWIFGVPADRLSFAVWKAALTPIVRLILFDWMLPAFLIGLWACRKRPAARVAALLVVLPILVLLKVHSANHNYYFIIEAPFILLLAALGLTEISGWRPLVRYGALLGLGLLLILKATQLEFVLGGMLSGNPARRLDGLEVKKLTDPKDIVFFAEAVTGGGLEITLYSERYLFFPGNGDGLRPTAFYFDEKREHFSRLNEYTDIWVDATPSGFFLYRTKGVGDFVFDAARHLAALDERPAAGDPLVFSQGTGVPVDVCSFARNRVIELGKTVSEIRVTAIESGRTVVLPRRNFLSLPPKSPLGCRFEVSL